MAGRHLRTTPVHGTSENASVSTGHASSSAEIEGCSAERAENGLRCCHIFFSAVPAHKRPTDASPAQVAVGDNSRGSGRRLLAFAMERSTLFGSRRTKNDTEERKRRACGYGRQLFGHEKD